MSNLVRVTLISFLAYAVMSGMLAQIGILITPISQHFDREATVVSNQFSWLTVGILVGAVISLFIFDYVKIKTLNLLVFTAIFLAILGFYVVDVYRVNAILLGIIGTGCGVALPAAAVVISRVYTPARRATMLVITDASFSLSGTLCTALVVVYLANGLHWSSGYSTVAALALITLVLTACSNFPEVPQEERQDFRQELATWPMGIYLCMLALLIYLTGQNFILMWLPSYAQQVISMSASDAGSLISNFWAGMLGGQLIAAAILIKAATRTIALLAAILTAFSTMPLWLVDQPAYMPYLSFCWGFVTLGLLKLILSLATEMVAVPSPRLVSVLLMAATTGTAISPSLSSALVAANTPLLALKVGTGCFFIVILLVVFAYRSAKPDALETLTIGS